jgi:cell division protein FtsL
MSVEPGGREKNDSSRGGSPTLWIGIAVICALAAVGLGIWAFTTKSDLDDAEAKIDAQQKALAAQRQVAGAREQRLQAFGDRERVDYRRIRRRLIAEDTTAADLKKRIENEAAQLDRANQDVRNAQGAT